MTRTRSRCGILTLAALLAAPPSGLAQLTGIENGEWRYLGGDAGHTRSSPLNQINASNFSKLKVAWIFRGDNFGPGIEYTSRSTPIYVDGMLYTVVGQRRQVVAIDAATGETRWTFREPDTMRYLRSPRTDFGKGVAYAEVDGRGVIFISTPAFFLWALDARTGRPLENWGAPVPLKDFPKSGVIDMIPDLVRDWGPWRTWKGGKLRPGLRASAEARRDHVLVAADRGQRRRGGARRPRAELRPDANRERAGRHPGLRREDRQAALEVPRHPAARAKSGTRRGRTTRGCIRATWRRGRRRPPTRSAGSSTSSRTRQPTSSTRATVRAHNLFGGSVLALDVKTGKRKWHFQVHHSDQWNYDIPTAPILMDLTVNGRRIPALIQNTKQGLIFALNRETGEPIWPIEERPVMQTEVPGNYTAPTQPYPTRPEPLDRIVLNGITEEFVHRLHARAEAPGHGEPEQVPRRRASTCRRSPVPTRTAFINNVGCVGGLEHLPSAGGRSHHGHHVRLAQRSCTAPSYLVPTDGSGRGANGVCRQERGGLERTGRRTPTTGTTVAAWKQGGPRPAACRSSTACRSTSRCSRDSPPTT